MMRCAITGIGALGPGFGDWETLRPLLRDPLVNTPETPAQTPKPQRLPPRERRRSPLAVKIAVEVANQACIAAGVAAERLPCVFASGMGDTEITDYMCRELREEPRLLSPTKFHNSVHNAPAGYWSISTACHQASTSVSAFEYSFPAALLEAASQCVLEAQPTLLVVQDIRVPVPLEDILPVPDAFAAALLLDPAGDNLSIELSNSAGVNDWPRLQQSGLQDLYTNNPSARALALLQCAALGSGCLTLPLSPGSALSVDYRR